MKKYFGCDAHKRYSVFACLDQSGHPGSYVRVENDRYQFRQFLKSLP